MNISEKFFNKKNENENIKHKEIFDLYDPISQILPKIKENIEQAKYKIIIGEDSSGRIPALVFYSLMSDVYKKNNFEKPNIFFIATHRDMEDKEVFFEEKLNNYFKEIFKKVKLINDDKILIVSDVIATGRSLSFITDYLKLVGKPYDIITTSYSGCYKGNIWSKKLEDSSISNVYGPEQGKFSQETHSIYNRPGLSGVKKDFHDIISHRNDYKSTGGLSDIGGARQDIKILVKKLIENFF